MSNQAIGTIYVLGLVLAILFIYWHSRRDR